MLNAHHKKNFITFGASLLILSSTFFSNNVEAGMYKCKDASGGTIYSDRPCVKTKPQNLDIMVAPVDKVSAKRLNSKNNTTESRYSSSRSSNNAVKSTKSKKNKNSNCDYYDEKIKSINEKMKSGYSSVQGEGYRESIRSYREQYRSCKNQ